MQVTSDPSSCAVPDLSTTTLEPVVLVVDMTTFRLEGLRCVNHGCHTTNRAWMDSEIDRSNDDGGVMPDQ